MELDKQLRALRYSSGWSWSDHVSCLRVSGPATFEVLDTLCPIELYLRTGQIRHTLLLREDAGVFADLYVCRGDEDYLLLAEGPSGTQVADHIADRASDIGDVAVDNVLDTHALLGLDGPYAWEVLAELIGAEAIGLPYMTYFETGGRTCFRAGKTGEYGYYVLLDRDECDAVEEKLESLAPTLDVVPVGLEALDQCALENWFFNIRREGKFDANPLELQLQWRVSYRKECVGSAALAECRASGPRTRLTCLLAPDEIRSGDRVMARRDVASSGKREGEIGTIVNAGFSQPLERWVGLALIDTPFAYPGIDHFVASCGDREVSLLTTSPPVLNNRSLYVSPQIHNYATRQEHDFPPIAAKGLP